MSKLLPVLMVLIVAFVAIKVITLLLPLLLLIAVIGIGTTLYLRSASHSDRQRMIRSARRFLR